MSSFDPTLVLPDDLLERIRSRAAAVDAENRFPEEDLAELRDAGYLAILVPTAFGGAGLGLAEAAILQQRLASAAPATALAIQKALASLDKLLIENHLRTHVAHMFAEGGEDRERAVAELLKAYDLETR